MGFKIIISTFCFVILAGCASRGTSSISASGKPIESVQITQPWSLQEAKYLLCEGFTNTSEFTSKFYDNVYFSDISKRREAKNEYRQKRAAKHDPNQLYTRISYYRLGNYNGSTFSMVQPTPFVVFDYKNVTQFPWEQYTMHDPASGLYKDAQEALLERFKKDNSAPGLMSLMTNMQNVNDLFKTSGRQYPNGIGILLPLAEVFQHPDSPFEIDKAGNYHLKVSKEQSTQYFELPISSHTQNLIAVEVIFNINGCERAKGGSRQVLFQLTGDIIEAKVSSATADHLTGYGAPNDVWMPDELIKHLVFSPR